METPQLRQARQVVESAVAFNLPEVEATVDEMQALLNAKGGKTSGKIKGNSPGHEVSSGVWFRSNLQEFGRSSLDVYAFFWTTSRVV